MNIELGAKQLMYLADLGQIQLPHTYSMFSLNNLKPVTITETNLNYGLTIHLGMPNGWGDGRNVDPDKKLILPSEIVTKEQVALHNELGDVANRAYELLRTACLASGRLISFEDISGVAYTSWKKEDVAYSFMTYFLTDGVIPDHQTIAAKGEVNAIQFNSIIAQNFKKIKSGVHSERVGFDVPEKVYEEAEFLACTAYDSVKKPVVVEGRFFEKTYPVTGSTLINLCHAKEFDSVKFFK